MSDEDGACYMQVQEHCCEICGMTGLTDDLMRDHTRTCHIEGNIQCPFCGFSGVVPAELLLHVNQAHLDYLTPENELMSFIDDQSPSVDFDSDSECRTPQNYEHNPLAQNNHNQTPPQKINQNLNGAVSKIFVTAPSGTDITTKTKSHHSEMLNSSKYQHHGNILSTTNLKNPNNKFTSSLSSLENSKFHSQKTNYNMPSCSNSVNFQQINKNHKSNESNKNCDMNGSSCSTSSSLSNTSGGSSSMNGSKEILNGFEATNGDSNSQGSPSRRSNLGLKLKSHSPATRKLSPLQCPLCPYTSDNANILEEHINRSHFDPLSPSVNGSSSSNNHVSTLNAFNCPICTRVFDLASDLELHVNIIHRDILSPGKPNTTEPVYNIGQTGSICPLCTISLESMKPDEMEMHIEGHFTKSPKNKTSDTDLEKEAQKRREQREFEMLRAQYGMDDQGNFREQSAAGMQRAVYAGEMSVADYYERQVGLRAAESHGIDDSTSKSKSVAARVLSLSSSSSGVIKSLVCSSVDHYASSYGDKGWGCGYRNLQMLLSSLLQNTTYNEALYSAWGNHGPSRMAMPSISRLQIMVEAAWAQGFDVQGSEQLGSKLYNTRKWIGATEVVTVLSWLRINCQLIDFHRPTSLDGRHPELFNWVLQYFEQPRVHTPPLYLQHQGHSRTIIGIEQRASGLTLLVLDPSHGPRQVAALGSSQDSLRLIRRGPSVMRAPQYQIVAVRGLIETEEQYQASKVLRSLRIPPDR